MFKVILGIIPCIEYILWKRSIHCLWLFPIPSKLSIERFHFISSRRQLGMEKQLKEKMIHSVMPPKVTIAYHIWCFQICFVLAVFSLPPKVTIYRIGYHLMISLLIWWKNFVNEIQTMMMGCCRFLIGWWRGWSTRRRRMTSTLRLGVWWERYHHQDRLIRFMLVIDADGNDDDDYEDG